MAKLDNAETMENSLQEASYRIGSFNIGASRLTRKVKDKLLCVGRQYSGSLEFPYRVWEVVGRLSLI